MNIGKKLKVLRLNKNMTQSEFAKLFLVTKSFVKSYEKGICDVNIEFLFKVCRQFQLSMDYFIDFISQKSNSKDLVVATKNGKQAIFDTAQSCYLTAHIYDNVCISKYGYHLVFNTNEYNQIIYSAMVNNFGEVIEYPGMELGNNGEFDQYGNIVAYNKQSNKVVLLNVSGKVLSGEYSRIHKINNIQMLQDDADYGLYFGCNTSGTKLCVKDLLDKNGNVINVTLVYNSNTLKYEIIELNNFELLPTLLHRYGIGMLYFVPNQLYENQQVYLALINYAINQIEISTENDCQNAVSKFIQIFEHLILCAQNNNVKIKNNYNNQIENIEKKLEMFIKNKIERNVLLSQIADMFNNLTC